MLWTAAAPQPVDTQRPAGARDSLAVALDHLPPDPLAVVAALAHLAGERRLVALTGRWAGGSTIISADPRRVVEARDPDSAAGLVAVFDDMPPHCSPGREGAVGGGWIGLVGHAVGAGLDTVAVPPAAGQGPVLPILAVGWYDHLLRFDGARWWAEGLGREGLSAAHRLADEIHPGRGTLTGTDPVATDLVPPDAAAHMAAVERAVTAIRTGQLVQTTICSRYRFRVVRPVAAWTALVAALSPDRAALVTGPWGALLGASPELYLRRRGRDVESEPIKGTSPAGQDPQRLQHSSKDIAENLMIVDLVRNDLSRVCLPGTVTVPDLLRVQPQTGVNHLVSRVTGRLRPEVGDAALVAATFPPGSVTGAPKLRATEVSNDLEGAGRGAHTGAVGLVSPASGLELAVTIRSVEVGPDGSAALGIGSGITVGSTPASEWSECVTKAAPLLKALGLVVPEGDDPSIGSVKGLADAESGLIETVLVVGGHPVEAADHTERLRRSFEEVYGRPLRGDPTGVLRAAAPVDGSHRMRLRVTPGRGGRPDDMLVDRLRAWPLPRSPARQPGLRVTTAAAPVTGNERHKYADRSWWDATDAASAGARFDAVIVTDGAGALLEGSRGNVFAVIDGHLVTPPADGRILPGTGRQQLIDEAVAAGLAVSLRPLGRGEVARADAIMLVNALRSVEWVSTLRTGGRALTWRAAHPLAVRAGELLITRWMGTSVSS